MVEEDKIDPIIVSFLGVDVALNPMEMAPRDGTSILVLLEKEFLGSIWHSASVRPNVTFVGHCFGFDLPKMLGWIPLPHVKS